MGAYVVRRLLAIIPLLLIISFIVFALSLLIPGDPART
ncbi:MAG: glutathione ABC transporter permease GsiC, partial [Acidimicrobiia bacterium]